MVPTVHTVLLFKCSCIWIDFGRCLRTITHTHAIILLVFLFCQCKNSHCSWIYLGWCVSVCVFASCYDDNDNDDTHTVPNEHAYLPFHTIPFHFYFISLPRSQPTRNGHQRNIKWNETKKQNKMKHNIIQYDKVLLLLDTTPTISLFPTSSSSSSISSRRRKGCGSSTAVICYILNLYQSLLFIL